MSIINTLFNLIKRLKYVAYIYGVLYLYQGLLGAYPLMLFYHLRGAYEWISNLLPVYALWTIASIAISFSILNKIRKL